jgi:pimeloyl-ACP methyl ester carboxylesterase
MKMTDQIGWTSNRRIRFHGDQGPLVITLHGGPGATGSAVRLAQRLSGDFRVIEPWQRLSGEMPLTVEVHIQDLRNLILSRCIGERPALVGSSWGAMLALAYAADHSETISGIALVGCGTFDKASRKAIVQKRRQKIADYILKFPAGSLLANSTRATSELRCASCARSRHPDHLSRLMSVGKLVPWSQLQNRLVHGTVPQQCVRSALPESSDLLSHRARAEPLYRPLSTSSRRAREARPN